ncbi:ABC transporter substrate-binding protein [Halochromatium salexigens]|nr:ABC transporter substrate-binding protein [Halochromatium salexigens]
MIIASRSRSAPLCRTLLLILAMGLTEPGVARAQTQGPPAQSVRVAGALYMADLPTLVAESKELFARHGLDAEVHRDGVDADNLARLRAGEVDFALMSLAPLVLDLIADPDPGGPEDPVILAGLIHSTDINGIVFHRNRAINAPSDLSGRQVALPPGTNAEFLWWLFSTFHGLPPDVRLLDEHAGDAIPALLAAGTIDAAVVREPWIARLRAQFGDELGQFPVDQLYTAKWVLVTSRRTARERRDLCTAMLATYREAIAVINEHRGDTLAFYAERMGVPATVLQDNGPRRALDYELSLDWSLMAALQQQADWAAAHQAPANPNIDVIDLIEGSILRALVPGTGGIPPVTHIP